MSYLLDTHAFLWALMKPAKLSRKVKAVIENASQNVSVSAVSFWEVSLKYALGKLEMENIVPEQLPEVAVDMGLALIPLAPDDAASAYLLPKDEHTDPFDRMLVWQCVRNRLALISIDDNLDTYKPHGLTRVW